MFGPKPQASPLVEALYRLGLLAQALLGLSQFIGGVGLWLSPGDAILRLVDWLTRNEMVEDPRDPIVSWFIDWASHISARAEGFYAFYLLGHGVLNIVVALALFLRWPGSFHLSMAVLTSFMIYQVWEYFHTFDIMLIVLTVIDIVVVTLIVLERRQSRARKPLEPHAVP